MAKRLVISLTVLLLLAILAPATAGAAQPVPQLVPGFQPQAPTGSRLVVAAYLIDPVGNPISGQAVTFSSDAEFMNTLGNIQIGQAVTDDTGLASFVYIPKSVGAHTITARFAGNAVFAPVAASSPLQVTEGEATYQEEQPFRIPGANVNLVALILTTVWGLYFVVTILFWRISRSGKSSGPASGSGA